MLGPWLRHLAQRLFNAVWVPTCVFAAQTGAAEFAEQVAGVEPAFTAGLVGVLSKLPVVEARA